MMIFMYFLLRGNGMLYFHFLQVVVVHHHPLLNYTLLNFLQNYFFTNNEIGSLLFSSYYITPCKLVPFTSMKEYKPYL